MELTHSAGKECVSVCFQARPRCGQNPCNYTDRPPPTFVYLSRRTRCSTVPLTRFNTYRGGKIKNRANAVATLRRPMELCLIKWRETFQSLQSDLNRTTTHSHAPRDQLKHTTSRRTFALSTTPSPNFLIIRIGANSSTPRPQRTVTVLYPLYSMYVCDPLRLIVGPDFLHHALLQAIKSEAQPITEQLL